MTEATSSRRQFVVRARFLCGLFVIIAVLIVVRLYFLQIVHGAGYREQALGQYTAQIPQTPRRGAIYFTAKDGALVSAAVMQTGWRLAITPRFVLDASATYGRLNAVVPIDKDVFMKSAAKKDDRYEEVGFRLDDAEAKKIRALKISGVLLAADQWRFYPGEKLAAQVLGFVAYPPGSDIKSGVYGLEKQYDATLSEEASGLYVNPFAQIFTNLEAALALDPAAHEGSLVTTIDPAVQTQLEKTLDGVVQEYAPEFAGGIVMDPKTGAIVAMAGRPGFDPNTFGTEKDAAVFDNRLVSGRYELGSIMKPLTMAAALDSGAVSRASTYNDTGCIERSTFTICNFDRKARGVVGVQQILSQSLNVGASYLAEKMGPGVLTRYMRLFGFGERTGVDLPAEVLGDLSPLGSGREPVANYDTAAFGQGVSVSPIEMVRALSSLANGGVLPSPHVVSAIKYESGITRGVSVPSGRQVLKSETAEEVTDMLVKVFDEGLLHGELKMDHYAIAAKTGTAQMSKPGGGYYTDGTFLHSFFGYFPAHDPRFVVFLFALKPHGVEYASASLAHPFADVAHFLINYYEIPPDR